jgi:membrane fusion protein, multidrug efflux system
LQAVRNTFAAAEIAQGMNTNLKWIGAAAIATAIAGLAYWAGTQRSTADTKTGAPPAAGGAAGASKGPSAGAGGPPPAVVEAVSVTVAPLAQTITAVGSLRSDEAVIIRPEVSGRISEIGFKEGQRVAKGSVILKLDAAVQRAELQQADANLSLAKSRIERARDLHAKGFISSQARDEAESNYKVAQASYELSAARLTKLDIRAPFNGIAGLRQVSVGDYVREGQDIVNIEEIDPLKVDFRVPEIFFKQVTNGQALQVSLDAFPNRTFNGRVFAINPLVDANGRSIVVRATVANTDARLRPGMFARVRLITNDRADGMTIPEQALIPSGDDFFVFRVVDGRAVRGKVEIGQRNAGIVEIVRGLEKTDAVVIAGQNKIRDGAPVKVAVPASGTPPATPTAAPSSATPATPATTSNGNAVKKTS